MPLIDQLEVRQDTRIARPYEIRAGFYVIYSPALSYLGWPLSKRPPLVVQETSPYSESHAYTLSPITS